MSGGNEGIGEVGRDELAAAIEEFNGYRSPEVVATLAGLGRGEATIIFTGTVCRSCGGQDYLEDFAYEASDVLKVPVVLAGFEDVEGGGFRARFRVGEGNSS